MFIDPAAGVRPSDVPAAGVRPSDDPAPDRYKMFLKMAPIGTGGTTTRGPTPIEGDKALIKGQYAFGSSDGIHWKLLSPEKVNPGPSNDTQYSVFRDDRIGKYVQYTRARIDTPEQLEYYGKKYGKNEGRPAILCVGRAVSDDFIHWTDEEIVFAPDDMDQSGSPGLAEGVNRLDFYGGNISKYTEGKDIYIGLPNAYYHWGVDMTRPLWEQERHAQCPCTMDIQLITSRDGINWNRTPGRRPFIGLGPDGSFWSRQIYPDGNALRVGDELWFYFAGLDVGHQDQSYDVSHGARGRAVLRLDGFISADAAYTGGELVTKPVVFSGRQLELNVDTGAGGTVNVEIQDEAGIAIPGFCAEESDEINGNYVRKTASWGGSPQVGSLAGKSIRLRFEMRDCKLYSFVFNE